jgi:uncharacterized membrane protein
MRSKFVQTLLDHRIFFLVNFLFLLIYCLITFVNHFNFRTYALDLGLYTNAVYDYAHLRFDYCEMFKDVPQNLLSDHFDPILILISPLYYLFGGLTLLIVQLVFIHLGALGVYKLAIQQLGNRKLSLLMACCLLGFYGVFSAIAFDAHTNVFAAMLFPWLLYFLNERSRNKTLLILALILLCKENMALWMIFTGLGLIWIHHRDKEKRKLSAIVTIISLIYFITITGFLMPALAANGSYTHMRYDVLGKSFGEILKNILLHPIDTFLLLFKNHSSNPLFNNYKIETHLFVLLSGGFFLLRKPQFLLMLLPVYFQKMYHNAPVVWSVGMHYNIEFAPVLISCVIAVISTLKSEKAKTILSWINLIAVLAVTIRLCDHTEAYTDKNRIRFYQDGHYSSHYDNNSVKSAFKLIPSDAAVSASSMFVPHLCEREKIYEFPLVKDAKYIVIAARYNTYPLSRKELIEHLIRLLQDKQWKVIYNEANVFIFARS